MLVGPGSTCRGHAVGTVALWFVGGLARLPLFKVTGCLESLTFHMHLRMCFSISGGKKKKSLLEC